MRQAHIRDGAALIEFLSWMQTQERQNNLPDELDLTVALQDFRARQAHFQGISFDTIAGSGAHGAIVHYRADHDSNRTLQKGELLLLDSGGQYLDGTTDITRTLAIGRPSLQMIKDYCLVLKGHIAIAIQQFPMGTTGGQLDSLARSALWNAGLDYAHGTGHGVGSYLNVHEGPQMISSRMAGPALEIGMVLSNEPGLYHQGQYGIRIENLVMVQAARKKGFLCFTQLTRVPYDRRLIRKKYLNAREINWLDAYHAQLLTLYRGKLSDKAYRWLVQACRPL